MRYSRTAVRMLALLLAGHGMVAVAAAGVLVLGTASLTHGGQDDSWYGAILVLIGALALVLVVGGIGMLGLARALIRRSLQSLFLIRTMAGVLLLVAVATTANPDVAVYTAILATSSLGMLTLTFFPGVRDWLGDDQGGGAAHSPS